MPISCVLHSVKSVQVRSFSGFFFWFLFWLNTGKEGPEKNSIFRHFWHSVKEISEYVCIMILVLQQVMQQHYSIKLPSIILLYVICYVYVQLVKELHFLMVSFLDLQSVVWAPSYQNIFYTNIYITIVITTWFQQVCCEFYLTFFVVGQNVYCHYF